MYFNLALPWFHLLLWHVLNLFQSSRAHGPLVQALSRTAGNYRPVVLQ